MCPNINCHVSSAGGEVGLIKLKPGFFFFITAQPLCLLVPWLYKKFDVNVPVGLCFLLFVQLLFKYYLEERTTLHVPPGDCIVLHLVILRFY